MRIALAIILVCLSATLLNAQTPDATLSAKVNPSVAPVTPMGPLDYVCPMDHDVRSDKPGKCPRCGMTLVLGIPEEVEYPMEVTTSPTVVRAGEKAQIIFQIRNPKNGETVAHYQVVHEKLFHMFLVSQDLTYFLHDHPVLGPDGIFRFDEVFPKPGVYRVLGDFYPEGGTPQLIARSIFVQGDGKALPQLEPAKLPPDLTPKHAENIDVELVIEPAKPIAGMKTIMFFRVRPADGMELYLGVWGHMLIASDDLVDLIHTHPFLPFDGSQIQFNMIFPRARTYRVWAQFLRKGVVNTVAFNIPISDLE